MRAVRSLSLVSLQAMLAVSLSSVAAIAVAAVDVPAGSPQHGWARYSVPLLADTQAPCCHSIRAGKPVVRGCDLDDDGGFSIGDDGHAPAGSDRLQVYLHLRDGMIDTVRAFGADCPVRHDGPITELAGVDTARSVQLLASLVDAGDGTRHDEAAIAAVAFHAGDAATGRLVDWAEGPGDEDVRRPALFWLGQTRGEAGVDVLAGVASGTSPEAVRSHAVFALAQSGSPRAYPAIAAIARRDRDGDVRSQAAFWMAQTGDPRAEADIAALLGDADEDVAHQAVFALTQLPDGGVPALIGILRGDYPREIKKQAMFWLGQSDSPQAIELFDEVLGAR